MSFIHLASIVRQGTMGWGGGVVFGIFAYEMHREMLLDYAYEAGIWT